MSLNKVILIGNVGKDPDVHYFDSKSANAKFTLATSERGYTFSLMEPKSREDRMAQHCGAPQSGPVRREVRQEGLFASGGGKINYRDYTDNSRVKCYVTEIIADRIEFTTAVVLKDRMQRLTNPEPLLKRWKR